MTAHLSTKIRAIATISSLGIIYIHHFFLNDIPQEHVTLGDFLIQHILSDGIGRFGLPFFWIMSGYLFFRTFDLTWSTYTRKLKNRFISLFIPYTLWSAWGILVYYFMQTYVVSDYAFSRERIAELNWGQLSHVWLWNPIPYQLWFLRELFGLVILSPLLYLIIKQVREAWVLVILILYICGYELLWPYQRMLSIFGFSLGGLFALHGYKLSRRHHIILPFITILWIVLMGLHIYWLYIEVHPSWMLPLYKFNRLVGVFVIWVGYDQLKVYEVFKRYEWSKELIYFSFFLYLFHEPVLTIIRKALLMILPTQFPFTLIIYLIVPIWVFIMALFIRKLLKWWVPAFYSLISGNR